MKAANSYVSLEEMLADIYSAQVNNQMPDMKLVQNFNHLAGRLPLHADDSWAAEAEDFAHLAVQLLQEVKKNKFEDAVQLTDSLRVAWSFFPYSSEYK